MKRFHSGIEHTLGICLILSLVMATLAKAPVNAQSTTMHAINPDTGNNQFVFDTSTTSIGYKFWANITLTDFTDVYTWQIKLLYDPILINATQARYPSDHIFAGLTTSPVAPVINRDQGFVLYGNTLVGADTGVSGTSARLFQVEFQIIGAPSPGETLSCELTFFSGVGGTFLLNSLGDDISFTTENGYYAFSMVLLKPWLEIVPNTSTILSRSEFTVGVYIRELSEAWRLIAVQLKLSYNTTLLEFVNATEGPFLPDFAAHGTYPIITAEHNYVLLGDMILPNATGYWEASEFPNGEGLLFTVAFKPLHFAPATGEFTVESLNGMFFMDIDDEVIPNEEPVSGTYQTNYEVLIHQIDYPPYTFYIETISDKLVSSIVFNQTGSNLNFDVTQYHSWEGFVNVTIPKDLMWLANASTDEWLVLVNDTQAVPIVYENSTHITLEITLNFTDIAGVYILSTGVVPEYSLPALMTVFLIFSLAAIVMSKRRYQRNTFKHQLQ